MLDVAKYEGSVEQAEDEIIADALLILENRLRQPGAYICDPTRIKSYLKLQLGMLEHETFGILLLDIRGRFISNHPMFRGTLNHISIYPREIVKTVLAANAASVVIYHNHPSGDCTPSQTDRDFTKNLVTILSTIDVTVHDHIIIAGTNSYSFKEQGAM